MRTKKLVFSAAMLMVIIALSSCLSTLYTFKINVLKPAMVKVQPDIKKVIIINHGYAKNNCSVTDMDGAIVEDFDSTMSQQYINALAEFVSNSPRFLLIKVYSAPFSGKESGLNILQKLADSLCKIDNADAAIILDRVKTSKTLVNAAPVNERARNSYGYKLILTSKANWLMYSVVNKKVIDNHLMKDSSNYYVKPNNFDEAKNKFPEVWEQFYQAGYRLGTQYGRRIAQEWISENRTLYCYPNSGFENALKYAKNNEWGKAIQEWEAFINDNNTSISAAAAYNIAVACEVNDDLDNALNWASKSYLVDKQISTQKYISSIEKRVGEKKAIAYQLGK